MLKTFNETLQWLKDQGYKYIGVDTGYICDTCKKPIRIMEYHADFQDKGDSFEIAFHVCGHDDQPDIDSLTPETEEPENDPEEQPERIDY